jgi:hypothetical protein
MPSYCHMPCPVLTRTSNRCIPLQQLILVFFRKVTRYVLLQLMVLKYILIKIYSLNKCETLSQ